MLHTYLTISWRLRYPIIGAPMAYVGRGRLACAVSQAGGLGMIGTGSTESIDTLPENNEARQQLAVAIATKNYDLAHIYAGEAVGLVIRQQPAGDVIRYLGDGAEQLLRERSRRLLDGLEATQ